ncbi:MAG: MGMT family protein [Euryarchaeota archaeon]|nr:MGMT family protein [Euryarchaeota archaeon]
MDAELPFSHRVREIIAQIPPGKIATYGQIAASAGNPRASRQVAWILSSSSRKYDLPWHRVVNRKGKVSLPRGAGYEEQRALLEKEGVIFDENDTIDFKQYGW